MRLKYNFANGKAPPMLVRNPPCKSGAAAGIVLMTKHFVTLELFSIVYTTTPLRICDSVPMQDCILLTYYNLRVMAYSWIKLNRLFAYYTLIVLFFLVLILFSSEGFYVRLCVMHSNDTTSE